MDNFTTEQVKNIILSSFSDFYIHKMDYLEEGSDNICYRINDEYIFRFPKNSNAEEYLRLEVRLLRRLREHVHLLIPNFEFVGNKSRLYNKISNSQLRKGIRFLKKNFNNSIFSSAIGFVERKAKPKKYDRVFVGYKEIKGCELTRDIITKSSAETQENIARDVAVFLLSLHSFPVSEAKELGVEEYDHSEKCYLKNYKFIKRHVFPQLASNERNMISELFHDYTKESANCIYNPSLLHGDLYEDHFIFDEIEKKIAGVIDFGGTVIGDPDYDLADIWQEYGKDFLQSVLRYYNAGDATNLLRKLKLIQCCWCAYTINRGLREKSEQRCEWGWRVLRVLISDLNN